MAKGYKGGDFEREVAKLLSRWWSKGLEGKERDDIFWRTSQSGGRATQRKKFGKETFGSYGDIAAVDPLGAPLLKLFTIELKRGSSHGSPGDLLDFKDDNKCHPWMKCLQQTIKSRVCAGSFGWMMVCRRDRRRAMVYMDKDTAMDLNLFAKFLNRPHVTRFHMRCQDYCVRFVGLPLDSFLARVSPKQIIECLNTFLK